MHIMGRAKPDGGQCPKCDKHYSNLLHHITKRHKHDRFCQQDVESAHLLVCHCGRVVLNVQGLVKHQSRFGCLNDAQTRQTPATSLLPIHRQTSTLTPLPTPRPTSRPIHSLSSSLTPLASEPSPLRIPHRPASAPSDGSPPTPGSPSQQIESPATGPTADLVPSGSVPSGTTDMDVSTDLDEVEEMEELEEADPAHEAEMDSNDMDQDNMDGDEGNAVDDQIREAEREAMATMFGRTPSATPAPDILTLPFVTGFQLLTEDDLSLVPRPQDVDRWELVISVGEYLLRFKDTLASVHLVNRAPLRKLHTTYHRGPAFNTWLLLAKASHQIWIPSRYKDDFFRHLNTYQIAQPGKQPLQASTGRALIPTSVFIHCLQQADCDTLRLKAYGQKMPIDARFLTTEPADLDHPWSIHNEWDVGQNFDSPFIWLFRSATGRRHGVTHYPMMIPGSQDFGTVNVKLTHNHQHFSVKIYPRIVHVIKSFNSRLLANLPKSVGAARKQLRTALAMIHSLSGKTPTELGGFRIEVTVKSTSLEEASKRVSSTPLLDPAYWMDKLANVETTFPMNARLVKKDDFLANANWVLQQADDANIFTGTDAQKLSLLQIQVLVDVFNALGWNPDLRTPTHSLDRNAWWHRLHLTEHPADPFLHQLNNLFQTDDQLCRFFNSTRTFMAERYNLGVPCKNHPDQPRHRYQHNNRAPFRVRCGQAGCLHRLTGPDLLQWVATLASNGQVEPQGLLDWVAEDTGIGLDQDH